MAEAAPRFKGDEVYEKDFYHSCGDDVGAIFMRLSRE